MRWVQEKSYSVLDVSFSVEKLPKRRSSIKHRLCGQLYISVLISAREPIITATNHVRDLSQGVGVGQCSKSSPFLCQMAHFSVEKPRWAIWPRLGDGLPHLIVSKIAGAPLVLSYCTSTTRFGSLRALSCVDGQGKAYSLSNVLSYYDESEGSSHQTFD